NQLRSGTFGQQLPRDDVAVMFHLREQNLVPALDILGAPRLRDEIDALGRAAGEDDLVRAGGVDELRPARARRLAGRGGAIAQLMNAAMHVRVIVLVIMP